MGKKTKTIRCWARRYLSWIGRHVLSVRCRFGLRVAVATDKTCTVVVASYGRPENLQAMMASLVKCCFIRKIVISNHNPEVSIRDHINADDDRISIINSIKRQPASHRFTVAGNIPDDYFLVLDDDIFLFPEQVRKLFLHLLKDPDIPHGFHGVRYISDPKTKQILKKQHFSRCETTVDVLHQGYAVTGKQIQRMLDITEIVDASPLFADVKRQFGDDILISFSGTGKAKIHNLGLVATCGTSLDPKIANLGRPGFQANRDKLFVHLTETFRLSAKVALQYRGVVDQDKLRFHNNPIR